MRAITITYQYNGPEHDWQQAIDAFIAALESDSRLKGRFEYQVAVADDNQTRIHWGRWDDPNTLAYLQAQSFFKDFATKIRGFSGNGPTATGHNVVAKTSGW
ncbi:MAG: hypothetical protein GJ676_21540 [Rhodobacteraceae bacterium]|nr:hypothetical protein [Paracoccaceae bacterium]